jgi:DNA invertase Pin-like site-specific DNA recombinase
MTPAPSQKPSFLALPQPDAVAGTGRACGLVPKPRSRINVSLTAACDELWYNWCMQFGYARVSTDDQTLDLQLDALTKAGCDRIFRDTFSGATAERPGLREGLDHLRAGDTLVVWRLDRLGRSLRHLIDTMTTLEQRGIGFRSLTESIDTTTSGGKLIFHIFGALAEFERDLIRERTHAGLVAARSRGRTGGRPKVKAFQDPRRLAAARRLYAEGKTSISTICATFGISKSTFYRYLAGDGTGNPAAPAEAAR